MSDNIMDVSLTCIKSEVKITAVYKNFYIIIKSDQNCITYISSYVPLHYFMSYIILLVIAK